MLLPTSLPQKLRRKSIFDWRERKKILVITALVLAAALVYATTPNIVSAWKGRDALKTAKLSSQTTQLVAFQSTPNQSGEVLAIQLRKGGFVPGEITRPKGQYSLLVNNASGEREIILRLHREAREKLHEAQLRRGVAWRQFVRLTPGDYVISEANHPDWVCRLTITP